MDTQLKKDLKRSAKVVTQDSAQRFVKRKTYNRINSRRAELIFQHTRNAEEEAEWKVLQDEVGRLVDLAYPFRTMTDDEDAFLKKCEGRDCREVIAEEMRAEGVSV